MERITLRFFLLLISLFSAFTYATPREIILVRHADKLVQLDPGPTLSAKGYVRTLKFTNYFLKQFGEPDFIVAGDPKNKDSSIRELQTIAPLVNILSQRHPNDSINILHPFTHDEYKDLANLLLSDNKFNDKLILICWRHTNIVPLAKALGVKDTLAPWPDDDYDSVFIIQYNRSGNIDKFSILHNQYPMSKDVTWDELAVKLDPLSI